MSGSNSSAPDAAAAPDAEGALSFTVHSQPAPQLDGGGARTTGARRGRWQMFAVLAVCAAPVIASYLAYFVLPPSGRTNYSELIQPTRPLPLDLHATTLDGRPFDVASLKGQWLIVVVADAACDARCENQLFVQRQLREALGREKERVDKLWFVTDSAPVRREVLEAISPGQPATVLRIGKEELARWLAPAAGSTPDRHFYVVDPMGQWMMRSPPDADAAKFKRDIDRLLRASAGWDQPGR